MKQLEVKIMGQNYLLVCPENGESRLREAVSDVDGAMCQIRDVGKVKARDRIAVLTALNLAYRLLEPAPPQAPPIAPEPAVQADSEALDAKLAGLLKRLDAALGSEPQTS
ncbi:MAG: cell division protein ZapA [Polaromonas sp.]